MLPLPDVQGGDVPIADKIRLRVIGFLIALVFSLSIWTVAYHMWSKLFC